MGHMKVGRTNGRLVRGLVGWLLGGFPLLDLVVGRTVLFALLL